MSENNSAATCPDITDVPLSPEYTSELSNNGSKPDPSATSATSDEVIVKRAFDSITDYLSCDLDGLLLDYDVLMKMNRVMIQHYMELNADANEIARRLTDTNERCLLLDYDVLMKMNRVMIQHYMELNADANEIARRLTDTNERYRALEPSLAKIDEFDASIGKLERAAAAVEQYCNELESKFQM
ncbi:hypothetical protein AHF37_09004 [Paragonimus kellicotti]|nr:hypothetical protein AHF37_09004 [Paragonimus kellicotti]